MATQHAPAGPGTEPAYYKVSEVAIRLNIGRRTAYELIASGRITAVRIGTGSRGLRVTREELARYEAELRSGAST